jgi:hypothetical protein
MARTVRLTEDAARRMAAATRAYERGTRDQPPIMFRSSGDDTGVRLGKTTQTWQKNSVATIQVWEDGTPPNETQTSGVTLENCVNKFTTVASGRWVLVASAGNGFYYLVAAEC